MFFTWRASFRESRRFITSSSSRTDVSIRMGEKKKIQYFYIFAGTYSGRVVIGLVRFFFLHFHVFFFFFVHRVEFRRFHMNNSMIKRLWETRRVVIRCRQIKFIFYAMIDNRREKNPQIEIGRRYREKSIVLGCWSFRITESAHLAIRTDTTSLIFFYFYEILHGPQRVQNKILSVPARCWRTSFSTFKSKVFFFFLNPFNNRNRLK